MSHSSAENVNSFDSFVFSYIIYVKRKLYVLEDLGEFFMLSNRMAIRASKSGNSLWWLTFFSCWSQCWVELSWFLLQRLCPTAWSVSSALTSWGQLDLVFFFFFCIIVRYFLFHHACHFTEPADHKYECLCCLCILQCALS